MSDRSDASDKSDLSDLRNALNENDPGERLRAARAHQFLAKISACASGAVTTDT
jgi:hypothetical protein